MDYLYRVNGWGSAAVWAGVNSCEYRNYQPDPFLWLARFVHDSTGDLAQYSRDIPESTSRTIVKEQPSFLDGLSLFYDVLTGGSAPRTRTGPAWNPRDRSQVSGIICPGYVVKPHRLSDMYVGGVVGVNGEPFEDFDVDIYVAGGGATARVFADQIFAFAGKIQQKFAGKLSFYWKVDLYNNAGCCSYLGPNIKAFTTRLQITELTDSSLSWSVDLRGDAADGSFYGGPTGSVINAKTSYTGKITREQYPWNIRLRTTRGQGKSYLDNSLLSTWHDWVPVMDVRSRSLSVIPTQRLPAYDAIMGSIPLSISKSSPALYHTQSRAFVSLLKDVSRNFESLVESPELLPMLLAATTQGWGDELLSKFSILRGPFAKAAFLVKLICGAYLGYIFAVSPALKSAWDVLKNFWDKSKLVRGKSYIPFVGINDDFLSLPTGLQDYLQAIWPEQIVRFDVLFGSQMMLDEITPEKTGDVLAKIFSDAARNGVEPNPAYLYAGMPFTFVFEWVVPVGALMNDAYNRFKLITQRGVTVGHTVSLSVVFASGLTVRMYLRSDPTTYFFDPPQVTWIQPTGAPPAVAIPLAVVMLL